MTYRITTARRSFSTIALAGMGVLAGGALFMTGVGVGMYPTEVNRPSTAPVAAPLPQATKTITAPPLPRATTTLTPAPKVITKVEKVPGATITKTREVRVEVPGATKTRYLPGATKTIYRDAPAKKVAEGKRPPAEDEPGFDCRTQGNRICGPSGSKYTPGCYRDGRLVIAWVNFKNPEADPLYGQVKSPC